DDDAEHREQRPELVGAQRAERDANDLTDEHGGLGKGLGSGSATAAAGAGTAAATAATWTTAALSAGATALLHARHAGVLTDAIIELLTLGLERRRGEHGDLLSFLHAADDL